MALFLWLVERTVMTQDQTVITQYTPLLEVVFSNVNPHINRRLRRLRAPIRRGRVLKLTVCMRVAVSNLFPLALHSTHNRVCRSRQPHLRVTGGCGIFSKMTW